MNILATDQKRGVEVLEDAVNVDYNSEIKLTTSGEQANEMPLRKVTLYKNNVAFYTRFGNIDDNHVITLSFPDDQAQRVIKTLKLKDYGDGSVTVQYRTDESDMQGNFFERVGVGAYKEILNSLRGIAVHVETRDSEVEGICVGTSSIQSSDDLKLSVLMVHILTSNNELKGVRVCDVASLRILDEKVANDFSYFIRGVPQTKQTKKKKIALSCQGSGTRRVEASYIGQGFQWSAQYRILFSNHVDPYVGEYQWQYLSDEYKWVPFPSDDNERLEAALQKKSDEFVEVSGGARKVNIISKIQMNMETNRMRVVRRHAAGDNVWVGSDGYRLEQVSGKNWVATFEDETEKFEYIDTDLVNDFIFLTSLENQKQVKLTTRNMQNTESGKVMRLGGWASRGTQKCSIQCLASVKNPTLEDWDEIELCLVAGGIQFVDNIRDDTPEPMVPRQEAQKLRERAAIVQARHHLRQGNKSQRKTGWFSGAHEEEEMANMSNMMQSAAPVMLRDGSVEMDWDSSGAEEADDHVREMPEPTGMAVSNARDEDMTMFTVRKPVTLAKNRAALVEMFESDLIDARKLVVCGLASYSLGTHSKSRIQCKNGIFMTNTSGHGLENGLCSVVDSTQDVYMGEGYLACKQDGVAIVTYANERTLRVEGKIKTPEDGITDKYENGSFTLLTMTGKPTEDVNEAYSVKVKGLTFRTTEYSIENSSRRDYPWVMIYHNSFGDLQSPKERFITFGRSDLHAAKRRFVCNVGPASKKKIEVVESKEFVRTKTLYKHRHNCISEVNYKSWIEGGLITGSMAKKLMARSNMLEPKRGFCSGCVIA